MDNEEKKEAPTGDALGTLKEALNSAVKAGVPEKDIMEAVTAIVHGDHEEEDEKSAAKDFGLPGFVN
jgi:hypothetical protein